MDTTPPPSYPTGSPKRRRAPGMSPEQRRAMIIQTALPLLTQYGSSLTTSRIALAAGIGEATIFRVFPDKDALMRACLDEAVSPSHVVRELDAIPRELALAERLAEAADALRAHLDRMGAVITALQASGHLRPRATGERSGADHPPVDAVRPAPPADNRQSTPSPPSSPPSPDGGREESMALLRTAVGGLLEPDAARLRLPVEQVAGLFLGLLFARPRSGEFADLTGARLAEVFLHGALGAREDPDDDQDRPKNEGKKS